MREFEFSGKVFWWAAVLLLAGCGGGGGSDSGDSGPNGGGDVPPEPSEFTASPQQLRDRAAIDSAPAEITLENTPRLTGAFYEFYAMAQELYYTYFDSHTWGFNSLDVRNGVFDCRHGGSVELRYSNADTVLSAFYSDCVENLPDIEGRVTLSGAERQSFLRDENGERYMRREYDGYRIAAEQGTLNIDGVSELYHSSAEGRPEDILLDLTISDSNGLQIRADNLLFDLYYDQYGVHFHELMKGVSGKLALPDGSIDIVSMSLEPLELRFTGATEAAASMQVGGSYPRSMYMLLGFDGDADGSRDSTLFAMLDEYEEEPFAKGGVATPLLRDVSQDPAQDVENLGATRAGFDAATFFRDPGGNLLTYSAELIKAEEVQGDHLYDPREEIEVRESVDFELVQDHAGHFVLSSELQSPLMVYTLQVTARNRHDEVAGETLLAEVPVYLDSDGDGEADLFDPDKDGDGVSNGRDPWPMDPSEWRDTDGDGIGDNTDEDDDGDGVADVDDVQPLDFLCSIESDTNGEVCLHRVVLGTNYDRRNVFMGSDGVVYFWHPDLRDMDRWDSVSGHFLEPVEMNPGAFGDVNHYDANRLINTPLQDAIYVRFGPPLQTRYMMRIDLSDGFEESLFLDEVGFDALKLGARNRLVDHTESALIFGETLGRQLDYVAVGRDGEVLDRYVSELSGDIDWGNDVNFRSHDLGPFCTSGFYFDEVSGAFVANESGDPKADLCRRTFDETGSWPRVSTNGELALTSEGIIDRFQNLVTEVPDFSPATSTWFGGNLYHLDREAGRLVRYSSAGEALGQMSIPEEGYDDNLMIAGDHLLYFGVHREDNHVLMLRYEE